MAIKRFCCCDSVPVKNKNNKKNRKKQLNKFDSSSYEIKEEAPPANIQETASDSDEIDLSILTKNKKNTSSKLKIKPPVEIKKKPSQYSQPVTHTHTTTTITRTLHSASYSSQPNEDHKTTKQKSNPPANRSILQNRIHMSVPAPLTLTDKIKIITKKSTKFSTAPIPTLADTTATSRPLETLSIKIPTPEMTILTVTENTATEIETPSTPTFIAELIGHEHNELPDEEFKEKSEKKGDDCFTVHPTPLSSLTIFTHDVNDDFLVNREQFPAEFLNFTTDLHDATYPLTKKHLYLTGGAITCLYEKEYNDGGDWDIVAFCKMNDLLAYLARRNYPYEVRGIYQIIHVTLPLQECDLLAVELNPTLDNLDALPITATAAYVRAPDGLYYINKLKNICDKIPLTIEMLAKFDKKLNPNEKAVKLSDEKLDRIKLLTDPPYRVHQRSIKVDITCIDLADYNPTMNELTLMELNLNERDLTQAGLHSLFFRFISINYSPM